MIAALLFFVLLQDGPIATAPAELEPQQGADCRLQSNRGPGEAEFDCAPRFDPGRRTYGRLGFRSAAGADGEVPAWALTDPARWEASQCGAAGDDACRRQARNQLAMARAGVAAAAPASSGSGAEADQNCRMVMQRSETGFGGSLSRICSTGPEAEASLNRLNEALRPTAEACDRPASNEGQDAWIARCRALPPR